MDILRCLLAKAMASYYHGLLPEDIKNIVRDKNDPMIIDVYFTFEHVFPKYDIRYLRTDASKMCELIFEDDDYDLSNIKMRYFVIDGFRVPVREFYKELPFLSEEEMDALLDEGVYETDTHSFVTGIVDFDEKLL